MAIYVLHCVALQDLIPFHTNMQLLRTKEDIVMTRTVSRERGVTLAWRGSLPGGWSISF